MEGGNLAVLPNNNNSNNNKRQREEEQEEKLGDEFTIAIDALTSASQIIDSRIANLKEREVNVAKRIKDMQDMETRIKAAEARIENDTQDVIKLNVGGAEFATTKTTMLKHKGTYFEELVKTGQCLKELTFVDRDPNEFDSVLNFMRDGKLRQQKLTTEAQLEFAFYGIIPNEVLTPALQNALRSWLPNKHFLEIFTGSSLPGPYVPKKLKERQEPMLIVIRSTNGHLFGGYIGTSAVMSHSMEDGAPLQITNGAHNDDDEIESFIFTLSNPHSIPPTRYNLNHEVSGKEVEFEPDMLFGVPTEDEQDAIEDDVSDSDDSSGSDGDSDSDDSSEEEEGETATQADLNISQGTSAFPLCYADSTGKGNCTFTGSPQLRIAKIWVYSVTM